MKEFLEGLEIGENKVKLSKEEIESILTKHGKTVTTETEKVKTGLENEINTYKTTITNLENQIKDMPSSDDVTKLQNEITTMKEAEQKRIAEEKANKEKSIRNERTNAFFEGIEFASESAKAGVIAQFNQKEFKYDEESQKFQGASEWLEELKKNDVGAFKSTVANPKFTTSVSTPTEGLGEIKNNVSLNSKFKNFN